MGDAAKSLAAEIEAIINRAKSYDTPRADDPRRRYTQAQMEIAVRAALQSRAFEDGARWTLTGKSLLSFGGGGTHEWFRRSDGLLRDFPHGFDPNTGAYGGAHIRVQLVDALPLQPEGERNA